MPLQYEQFRKGEYWILHEVFIIYVIKEHKEHLLKWTMASNKKINVPITSMSSDKIYALLDTIESDDEEDIENLMNDSDTEFTDESPIENGGSKSDLLLSTSCLDIENHLSDPNASTPIEAVVRISQPGSDSDDDVSLSSLQVPKADKE